MKKENRKILKVGEWAFRNITILLLFVLIGIKVDEQLDTKPTFIIILSLLAVSYLVISLIMLGSKGKWIIKRLKNIV